MKTKIVNFHGMNLRIPANHRWLAMDEDMEIFSYATEPAAHRSDTGGTWVELDGSRKNGLVAKFRGNKIPRWTQSRIKVAA